MAAFLSHVASSRSLLHVACRISFQIRIFMEHARFAECVLTCTVEIVTLYSPSNPHNNTDEKLLTARYLNTKHEWIQVITKFGSIILAEGVRGPQPKTHLPGSTTGNG